MAALPIPTTAQLEHGELLKTLIRQKIHDAGGWVSFADFMHLALYTPALGYYSGGAQKFGLAGDFVTAPEISPLFAQTIARQAMQVMHICDGDILEIGAGTGRLAKELLLELQLLESLPQRYLILEVSDHLRHIQQEVIEKHLPIELQQRVVWLNDLPENFNGLMLGNEVLDAIPVHLVHKTVEGWFERGVGFDGEFVWLDVPLTRPELVKHLPQDLPNGYLTEVCPAASGLIHSLADSLQQGAILLVDYGFSAHEYYHPQRSQGTLMCHFQHHAHPNPLIHVGLQDVTAHVDFTQIALAGKAHGVSLSGYATQAQFLMNCGILDILAQHSPDSPQFMQLAAAAQKYLSPAEMGDLFKVIAFAKNMDEPLIGFAQGDKSHTL
ncbi:MAG TPA: SAM-dependent methyltransferase [Methylophilus sp.]|nr:SAM-dependent methyltransferase [Methylophilus sp.]HQQ32738.1 SAM-dependent methyltransferase [Methylophilus sp.]